MLLAAVLFFQGGMEGSVNNWTTTFLQQEVGATTEKALFALSSFVAGLAIARLLLSRLLKRFPAWKVLAVSVAFSAAGCLMLWIAGGYASALSGLVLLGIGFAGVFPIILGIVGDLYASISGTAFSIVFVVSLIGNMASNYLVGVVGQLYGIRFLPVQVVLWLCIMSSLMRVAFKELRRSHAC
jgi:fucose permease